MTMKNFDPEEERGCLIIIVIAIVFMALFVRDQMKCEKAGGVLVQVMGGHKCVKKLEFAE